MKMIPVLIPVHINTFFVELQRVGQLLHETTCYEPVFLFAWPYPTMARDIDLCLKAGITCLDENGKRIGALGIHHHAEKELLSADTDTTPSSISPLQDFPRGSVAKRINTNLHSITTIIKRVVRLLRVQTQRLASRLINLFLGDYLYYLKYHRQRQKFAEEVLKASGAKLLIMGGDMVGYDTADIIKVAHRKNVPVVLVPSTMSNGLEQCEAYYHDPAYQLGSLANKLAAIRHPKWVRQHRKRKLVRRPAGDIFASERLGISPPLPWIFNSGFADAICVESEAMRQYYLEGGLPASQLFTAGSLANDVLADVIKSARARRTELLQQLDLSNDHPVILVALPPDFLYLPGGRPECDFQTYEDLTTFWISTLQKLNRVNVIIALHPSISRESMLYLESSNLKIASGNTASLIPLCDIYVASVSSTIRWAIACGKPVINYDVYRYRYTDFSSVPGVIRVEEQDQFESVLLRLVEDKNYFQEIEASQKACAGYWGLLDGHTGSRMLELFHSLTKTNTSAAA